MISIGLFLVQSNREILRNPLLISDIIRTEYEQGYAQCSDKPDVNDQPIGRGGWVRGRGCAAAIIWPCPWMRLVNPTAAFIDQPPHPASTHSL